ncbi:thiamine-phosphate kinase [Comamonas sp. MYb69]|uniref:thiamine-phosphate kinase n=1 Tax=Comamonas sp. MYb69 TaxID=1848650 RepID=UPI0030A81D94
MAQGEFELIAQYFQRPVQRAVLGVGDDCALLAPRPGMQLAISSDMLVQGRHFFADVDPRTLGHKALAVNLSDLAATGAQPLAFTLALALPAVDGPWLQGFSEGMFALADAHGCELVGGDTTQGPLNICITVFGEVPAGQALLRSGAQPGDDIYVSGQLGDARLALEALLGQVQLPAAALAAARQRLESPSPRVALGTALRGIASSALDLSDGLVGDLGHILQASEVGAELQADRVLACMAATAGAPGAALNLPIDLQLQCCLAGGDDYELCFTAAADRRDAVQQASLAAQTPVQCVGRITAAAGLRVHDAQGQPLAQHWASFDHFKA